MKIRTRFAPSPTGPLHMGGVRTALYAFLLARKSGGSFILRIEDTDQNRFVPGAEEYIIESLRWCNILPDEGVGFGGKEAPYRQSERQKLGYYQDYALRLLEAGLAYYAFDQSDDLDLARKNAEENGQGGWQYDASTRMAMRNSLTLPEQEVRQRLANGESAVIRLKVEPGREIAFTDSIRGEVRFDSSLVDDKVLIKADGMPTYHLAHIVDDIMMGINHAVRGEEWLPSAPAHILLYEYLGLRDVMPQYAHLPLLLKPEGSGKLSKRDGDRLGFPVFPLEWKDPLSGELSAGFREKGYYPEAFVNLIALLGWNPGSEKELFSLDELISEFSFDRVQKAGARFDPVKARWFNEQWLRRQSPLEIGKRLLRGGLSDVRRENQEEVTIDFAAGLATLWQERVQFEEEIPQKAAYMFRMPESYDQKVIDKRWTPAGRSFMTEFKNEMKVIGEFTAENLRRQFDELTNKAGLKSGDVLPLFRVLLTGESSGADLFGSAELLGREACVSRIEQALTVLPVR